MRRRSAFQGLALGGAALAAAGLAPAAPAPALLDVRFGPEADYGPFVFVDDDGRVDGLSVEMLGLVARHAALRVQTQPARPLQELLVRIRAGELDLLSSLRPTPERADYLAFTTSYVRVPAVLVVAAAHPLARPPQVGDLSSLAGRPVAVGAGYAVETFVRQRHPAVDWQPVTDDVVALRGVAQGRFEAAVADAASLAFVSARHRLDGLVDAGAVGFDYALSFAVRKADTGLLQRLDAGIRAVSAAERAAVVERWMRPLGMPASQSPMHPVLLPALGLLGTGMVIAAVGWTRERHRRQQPDRPGRR